MRKSTKKTDIPIWFALSVSRLHTADFFSQISMLLNAGFPMKTALNIVYSKTGLSFFRKIIPEITDKMSHGAYFSETLSRYRHVFTKHDIGIIKIGEKSGRLSNGLAFLSECIQREEEGKKKILSAVSYPVFISVICILSVFFVVPVVASTFASLYMGTLSEMPQLTLAVIEVSGFLSKYAPYIAVFILLLFVIFSVLYRKSERFSVALDSSVFRLPIIGAIEKNKVTAMFARAVGWLSASGCKSDEMFAVVASAFENKRLVLDISAIPEGLQNGISFSETVSRSACFSPEFKESSALFIDGYDVKNSLFRTADMLEKENEMLILRASNVAGVALTLFAAVLILIIALAVLLPVFSIKIQM